ncbi:Permease of the major facilitator superfamily [Ceraceosorus bombacis]|uniref:Permease of the major facilitator superfamily n=1 Tax=Ceraceosorus bombacis TaxID=401625 RepID=A0A0P1BM22_9BASI|nr:Permease of the major facilitator superfamily [Ceraceosorus bombacis]
MAHASIDPRALGGGLAPVAEDVTIASSPSGQNLTRESEKVTDAAVQRETNDVEAVEAHILRRTAEQKAQQRAADEKRLVRKIDIRLIPIAIILYLCNYLDRNTISAARLSFMQRDLDLDDSQWATSIGILFVSYIPLQLVSNLLLAWFGRPRLFILCAVILWGTISALTSLAHNFASLILIRLSLGVAETVLFPGMLFVLSKWYTRKELSLRMALLFSGSLISNAISGLISAGILGGLEGAAGIRAWRWLFIILGACTVVIGFLCMLVMPDFPENTSFLTEEERTLAVGRIAEDGGERDDGDDQDGQNTPMNGFKLAVKDPATWVLTLMQTTITLGTTFNQYFPTVVSTLGFEKTTTLLITCPIWAFGVIVLLLNALHADRTGERTWHIITPLLFGIAGFIIASATTALGSRFLSLFLMVQSYAAFPIILSWIAHTLSRPTYKRTVGIAICNALSQISNIVGAYMWGEKYAPRYWPGNLACSLCFLICIGSALSLRVMLLRRQKQLDTELDEAEGTAYDHAGPTTDLTIAPDGEMAGAATQDASNEAESNTFMKALHTLKSRQDTMSDFSGPSRTVVRRRPQRYLV